MKTILFTLACLVSASLQIAASSMDDWTPQAPRDEIRPQFERVATGGARGCDLRRERALAQLDLAIGVRVLPVDERERDLSAIEQAGAQIRVASGNYITAKPMGIVDGIDMQHTGEVRRIDNEAIKQRLEDGAFESDLGL